MSSPNRPTAPLDLHVLQILDTRIQLFELIAGNRQLLALLLDELRRGLAREAGVIQLRFAALDVALHAVALLGQARGLLSHVHEVAQRDEQLGRFADGGNRLGRGFLILREELPTSGKVTVLGKDVAHLRRRKVPYLRRQMGIIFQDFRLIPSMTVYENIAFAMHVTNVKRSVIRERVEYMLELVHLEDKAKVYPDTLSGGEQQRVAVARALAHSPKLVIADEPTGNIDPELSLEMMELLERVSQTGITVLVVTHEHELVHRFHQRVVTLKNGRIISDIPADPEAIAARSAELNAWKELTEPVDDEPDEQNDETKEKEAATV